MDAILVYGLHWVFAVFALLFSWRRAGHYLHPHFLFTGMLVYFLLDFLMRGYDDDNLQYIKMDDVLFYQVIMLTILSIVVFTTSFVKSPALERHLAQVTDITSLQVKPSVRRAIFGLAFVLLAAELIKRLSIVDWSLDEVVRQSLGPRGERDWAKQVFTGNYVFAIVSIIFPIASVSYAYLFATGQRSGRFVALALFLFVLAILITDGSRTQVAISFATLGLFWMLRYRSFAMRVGILSLVLSAMIGSFALMYTYRSSGYIDQRNVRIENELVGGTHQDDNYYRAIYAYSYADQTGKRWDPWFFFWAIATNPIPRVIWPGKPLMDEYFYDGFKCDYCTNSFLGETVAMTGVTYSVVFAPLLGFLFYLILFNAVRFVQMPMGVAVYLLVALYVYMIVRSMPNLVFFSYLPAAAAMASILLDRQPKDRSRKGSDHLVPRKL